MAKRVTLWTAWILTALAAGMPALAITVTSSNGLDIAFSDADGSITTLLIDGVPLPLLPDQPGGLAIQVGQVLPPAAVCGLDFDVDDGGWTAARNADWDDAGPFVTWLPDGGIDGSGHVLLGDGVTAGAGMAMAGAVPVIGGSTLRISWQARAASVETTMILCVRLFDETGADITATTAAPPGWSWTATSQAHAVWGQHCAAPDEWEMFEQMYFVAPSAAAIRVSLRHWTGGDHLVHIDDLYVDRTTGLTWSERIAVAGPLTPLENGFVQTVDLAAYDLHVTTSVVAQDGHIRADVSALDLGTPQTDRPLILSWALPVDAAGWSWWDDIDTSRQIGGADVLRNAFDLAGHAVSLYPFCSVGNADVGLALGVPMSEPVAQRFEYDPAHGLRSTWELALSPLTVKLGSGQAAVSLVLFRHEAAWGFRAAAERYYALFPEYFVKRTSREGAWMYPIPPSQIPDPQDFGFAFFETQPLDAAERELCAQYDIGIFHYSEPWLAWQYWGDSPEKPPYEERVARLEQWAADPGLLAAWLPDGGVADSGHLLLGDGVSTGAGMATAALLPVTPGDDLEISWQARVADTQTTQILCLRLFDGDGTDITAAPPAPAGWFWSGASQAHVIAGIAGTEPDQWESFAYAYSLPAEAAAVRLSLRHWTGGDHYVHIDDLLVTGAGGGEPYLLMAFETDDGAWTSAQHADWDDSGPIWLHAPRQLTAQAVINASPLDADGHYLIDSSSYFWHEWAPDSWNQAWPVNPDPDHPSPSGFDLYHDYWILYRLEETDGVYIDSVTAGGGVGGWENRRADHLAWTDSPLTFSPLDGGAAQLGPQAHAEFLDAIAGEIRGTGRVMMLNLFPSAMRFHAHQADFMGSETSALVEPGTNSRLRRTLAATRIVSNLLQRGWDSPEYATYAQMEEFIRGQLFWGFYPAVSSAGGMLSGGTPDRYFLHPELYERDRPLFQLYIPVIRELSGAGWEPVTRATVTPEAEIERFGSFSRGPVLFTVRGAERDALEAEVAVDLAGCDLAPDHVLADADEALLDQPLAIELLPDPRRVRFAVLLDTGEVGVVRFESALLGDFDRDGDADFGDFAILAFCLAGPSGTYPFGHMCALADANQDGDVDLADLGRFQASFTARRP